VLTNIGTLYYVYSLDAIAGNRCGDNKLKSQYTAPDGSRGEWELYPPCNDPTYGVLGLTIGLGAIVGGIVAIATSRKTVVVKS
jgi:hypothetical protein